MSQPAVRQEVAEVVERASAPVASAGALTPLDMLSRAIASGADMGVLEKLMALHERWEAGQARKAFDEAIGDAKAEMPTITKNKTVGFDSRRAGSSRTEYRHETLDEIARIVTPILAKHGLSYRFRATSEVNQPITVTCIVSHRGGHSEETTLIACRDESGNKNAIQQIGSTITYLQRYTLKAALGLAAADDDDGKASSDGPALISEDQIKQIRALIVEAKTTEEAFCKAGRLESIESMGVENFDAAVSLLKQKAARR